MIRFASYAHTGQNAVVQRMMMMKMKIVMREKLVVENPTPELNLWCRQNLVLDNPDYYQKERMGKWTGLTPKTLQLYEIKGNTILLPFGCAQELWKFCRDAEWKAEFSPIRAFDYQSHINLYTYQEKAVQAAVRRKNGILVMPCGSGKTQSGLELISRIGGRALWLTHTQDLLTQSKQRAETVLGNVGCGIISNGKVNAGNGITFATVQTFAMADMDAYRDFWDVIIVDECQHCAGTPTKMTMFYRSISRLCARYKFGLTATPKRADGLEGAMFALLGDVIHEVTREEVEHTTCPVKVKRIETGWSAADDAIFNFDGTIDYAKVIDAMICNEERYHIIFAELMALQGSCIVLANRVNYLERLCADSVGFGKRALCLSGMSQSKKAKEERKEALRKLNNGELDIVFATYQLAKEGLDVPSLKYVVFATPEKDETTVIQSVGRVGRRADGKDCGMVIDFVDDFPMYRGWAKKRSGYYWKINAEII